MRPVILGGKLDNEEIKNVIPEPVATPPPRLHQQPFDYDGEVYIGTQTDQRPEDEFPEEEEEEEEEEEDNGLNPRGDVFSKRRFFFFSFGSLAVFLSLSFWVVHNVLTMRRLNKLSM